MAILLSLVLFSANTIGLGGYLQGGGHGPLSSQFCLGADQIHQATVVTTEGDILIANSEQNADLLWAIRGGRPGLYGVVTEYVLKTYPAPTNGLSSNIVMAPVRTNNSEASWNATAVLLSMIPDIMDAGLAGVGTFTSGTSGSSFSIG